MKEKKFIFVEFNIVLTKTNYIIIVIIPTLPLLVRLSNILRSARLFVVEMTLEISGNGGIKSMFPFPVSVPVDTI